MSQARAARQFVIERMTEHDLLEVVEIEKTSGLSLWGWDAYHTELLNNSDALMLVARDAALPPGDNENVFGFVAARLSGDELHVNNIAVREELRRCGIGGALLETACSMGAARGARTVVLEVRLTNLTAQALYARHGFHVVARRPAYYTNPTEDALLMTNSL